MQQLTIERDAEQQLRLTAEGTIDHSDLKARVEALQRIEAGTFLSPESINFDASMARYALTAFLEPVPEGFLSRDMGFRQRGRVARVVRTWTHKVVDRNAEPKLEPIGTRAFRSEWFLNGPKSADFMRATIRRHRASYRRERAFRTVVVNEAPSGADTLDHIVLDTGASRFAVCKVPDEFVRTGYRGLSIEYQAPVPDDETREAIAEIVSFILGRRLLRVGATVFDSDGDVLEEELINPAADCIAAICARSDRSPLPVHWHHNADVEQQLGRLVSRYVSARAEIGLRNAMLAYWAACESPVPIDLALFRGAVEALKTAWFASKKTKSKGEYMARTEYEEISREHVEALRTKLGDRDGSAAIVRKLQQAHRMGSNEQVRTFFEEIGLPVGAVEEAAHRAANAPAHGTLTGSDQTQLVRHAWACRILFERALLKLLDYDGCYVDRTASGFPERHLLEPPTGWSSGGSQPMPP